MASLHMLGALAKGKCNCKSKTHILTNYKMRRHGVTCPEKSGFGLQSLVGKAPALGLALADNSGCCQYYQQSSGVEEYVPGLQVAGLRQLLHESTRQPLGLSTGSVAVFQELCQETIGRSWDAGITCCCAAIAVLWLAFAPERFPLQAHTFSRTASTAGKQKVVPDFTKQCKGI